MFPPKQASTVHPEHLLNLREVVERELHRDRAVPVEGREGRIRAEPVADSLLRGKGAEDAAVRHSVCRVEFHLDRASRPPRIRVIKREARPHARCAFVLISLVPDPAALGVRAVSQARGDRPFNATRGPHYHQNRFYNEHPSPTGGSASPWPGYRTRRGQALCLSHLCPITLHTFEQLPPPPAWAERLVLPPFDWLTKAHAIYHKGTILRP